MMCPERQIQNYFFYKISNTLLSLFLPAIILIISVVSPGMDGYDRAMLPDMVYGRAHKPYVYRTLVPSITRLAQAVIPMNSRLSINEKIGEIPAVNSIFEDLGWNKKYLVDYAIVLIVLYISLVGFLGAIKYLLKGVVNAPPWFIDASGLVTLAILPLLFKYYSYIYDFPHLFLFTLALGLMARKRWGLFLEVFLVACFNKETTVLLTMVFFFQYIFNRNMERKQFWKLLITQAVIFMVVKGILYYIFKDNPGSFVEFHLYDYNMILLRKLKLLPTIGVCLPVSFLVFYGWQRKPLLLKNSLWIAAPLLILTLFLGFLDEWRDYYEVYPVVILLIMLSIGFILKIKIENV